MTGSTFSQLDFISSGRAWERAYFTTYALSLTFFESYLLPSLRKAGCERVTVFVDVDGYRASLMELKSQSVGQEYSLIPIRSATGIFHPKITYLWSEKGDILLVGSGNLTFGGHGRNIEVLEALNPENDSEAFSDFSDFMEQLVAADSLKIPNTREIIELSRRARDQASVISSKGNTRLLHSIQISIMDQIVERAASRGPWEKLICLSPYHDKTGRPVRELVERLGVKSLSVGIPPSPNENSSFPFSETYAWDAQVKAVAPRIEKPGRPLHAKWIELRGLEHWTLTGSVNATRRSLASTENVEVAVLRELQTTAPEDWKSAKEPRYERTDFSTFGENQDLVLHAEVSADGSIEGQLLGNADLSGTWTIQLRMADERGPAGETIVQSDGCFNWRPDSFNEFAQANSVQIILTKDQSIARGWLTVQSILKLPSRSRAAQAAIARMLARGETLDDWRALLDYIAFHSQKLVDSPTTYRKNQNATTEAESADETFLLTELSLDGRRDTAELLRDLAEEASKENRSWKTLLLMARLLGGRSLARVPRSARQEQRESQPEEKDDEIGSEHKYTREALDQFNEQIFQELGKAREENRNLVPVLIVWLNVNLDMCLRYLEEPQRAFRFLDQWMRITINLPIAKDVKKKGLDESVYGVAAALGLRIRHMRMCVDEVFRHKLSPELIHQWLESYIEHDVDPEIACERAKSWFQTETPNRLADWQVEDATHALREVLATPTRRNLLAKLVEAHSRVERLNLPEDTFSKGELVLLDKVRAANPSKPKHKVVRNGQTGCPKCYASLHTDIRSILRARRIAQCIQCNTILFLLEP